MKKNYVLFALLLWLCSSTVKGQTFTISGGATPAYTTNTNAPINSGYKGYRVAYLFPKVQLNAGNLPYGALLSSIAFERSTGNTISLIAGGTCKIYLDNKPMNYPDFTGDDLTWATTIPTATLLYNDDPASIVGNTAGFKTFPFGTGAGTASTFVYTGGAIAVYIETILPTTSSPISWNLETAATATPAPAGWTSNSIKQGAAPSSTTPPATLTAGLQDRLPRTQFVYTITPCSGMPTAGTTTSSTSVDICTNAPVTIALTGNSYGSGLSFQLQSAATSGGTYTNVGAALPVPSSTFPVTTTMWYRYAVTCGSQTSYAAPVKVTVPPPFPGGTYTIDKSLPTAGTNFHSFAEAALAVACGTSSSVIFNVAPTTTPYNEQFEMTNIYTTSATNTITFNGNNDTISFAGTVALPYTMSLNGTDYVRFNNLNFVGTDATSAMVVHLWNDANNNIFTNCTFTVTNNSTSINQSPFSIGAAVNTVSNPSFSIIPTGKNNVLTGCKTYGGNYGIALLGTTTANIAETEVINCDIRDFATTGIYINLNKGAKVLSCNIEKPTRIATNTCQGIIVNNTTGYIVIEKNKIHDLFKANPTATNTAYGLQYFSNGTLGNENRVINNVVYNMQSNGDVTGLYFSSTNYIKIQHNTINLDYAAATAGAIEGIYSAGTTGGIDITNNNISIVRGGTGTKYCIRYSGGSGRRIADNNNYYINSPAGSNNVGYADNGARLTLADWQTATGGLDMNALTIDPAFANAATGDLKPTNIALDNKGMGVGQATDILGVPRNASVPDIGAYEFGTLPCDAVDTLYVSNISADSATITWNPVLGATDYQYVVDQTMAAPSGTGTTTTDTGFIAKPLAAGTKYYVHLRTKCITGNLSAWIVDSFVTPCIYVNDTVTAMPSLDKLCMGDSVRLSVRKNAAVTYQWYKSGTAITGATDTAYVAKSSGNYQVYITSTPLCVTTSGNSNAIFHALPVPVITPNGTILSTGTYASYQWNKNGQPIANETGKSYTYTDKGASYTVTVTDSIGCAGTSAAYTPPSGVTMVHKEDINIYPNPATDMIYVAAPIATKIIIYAMDGKVLLQQNNTGIIDIRSFAAGVYTIKVTDMDDAVITVQKIIKVQR